MLLCAEPTAGDQDLEGVIEGKGSDGSSSNSVLAVCTGGVLGSGRVLADFGV